MRVASTVDLMAVLMVVMTVAPMADMMAGETVDSMDYVKAA